MDNMQVLAFMLGLPGRSAAPAPWGQQGYRALDDRYGAAGWEDYAGDGFYGDAPDGTVDIPLPRPRPSPPQDDMSDMPSWPIHPPDDITPGAIREELSLEDILATKWGDDPRRVTSKMKQEAFENYDLSGYDDTTYRPDEYGRSWQIDHLIPRQMGGADEMENLWPAPYGEVFDPNFPAYTTEAPWNVVRKDITANRLMQEVREGRMSLEEARERIQGDWTQTYMEFYGDPESEDLQGR